jgi:hypothetical protein
LLTIATKATEATESATKTTVSASAIFTHFYGIWDAGTGIDSRWGSCGTLSLLLLGIGIGPVYEEKDQASQKRQTTDDVPLIFV